MVIRGKGLSSTPRFHNSRRIVMDDRENSRTHSLVKDYQNDVKLALAALSEDGSTEGVFVARYREEALDYLYRRVAHRSQAVEDTRAALLDLHSRPSSAAEREL